VKVAIGVGIVVGFGNGVAWLVPIGGGVGGGVAASATLRADGEANAKTAAAVAPPAVARKKEGIFIGYGAFCEAGKASFLTRLL
jgi:hypothetical protein